VSVRSCLPSLGDPPCGACHRCQQADEQEKCRRCLGTHVFGTCDHLDGKALQAQRHGNARSLDAQQRGSS
jgi:hypothetical protein